MIYFFPDFVPSFPVAIFCASASLGDSIFFSLVIVLNISSLAGLRRALGVHREVLHKGSSEEGEGRNRSITRGTDTHLGGAWREGERPTSPCVALCCVTCVPSHNTHSAPDSRVLVLQCDMWGCCVGLRRELSPHAGVCCACYLFVGEELSVVIIFFVLLQC